MSGERNKGGSGSGQLRLEATGDVPFPRCCSRCWHGPDRPCSQVVSCLAGGPLCHESVACRAGIAARNLALRRVRLERPAILVGTGTCGTAAGAGRTLAAVHEWLARAGRGADVVEVGCLGLCSSEPLLDIQLPGRARLSFQRVEADLVADLLESVFAGRVPADLLLGQHEPECAAGSGANGGREGEVGLGSHDGGDGQLPWEGVPRLAQHPFFALQTRRVLADTGRIDPGRIDEYLARGGYRALADSLRNHTRREVVTRIAECGLRERGSSGLPVEQKWAAVGEPESDHKVLVCNAEECDPGAFLDRALIEGDPHRLLEGIAIAAYTVGARRAYVYLRSEHARATERLKGAIRQARAFGFLGRNILDSGFDLEIALTVGAGASLCGGEPLVGRSGAGRRSAPRPRPPFPELQGLFDRPTVIENVETLANVPSVLARGAEWYRALGTAASPGTKVLALSGRVRRSGLIEVPMGTSVRRIIFEIGGGVAGGKTCKAAQIGGPSGGCIPEAQLDTRVDHESLSEIGALMGSGGLVVLDENTCMVDLARFFTEHFRRESCGKCAPCREGTKRISEALTALTRSRGAESGAEALTRFQCAVHLGELAEVVRDTSLCGLGRTASHPVLSTLRHFREEYEEHIYERRCRAGVCTELRRYRIEVESCKGCGLCLEKCPARAILGAPRSPHFIIEDRCIACATCLEVCGSEAVVCA